MDYENDLDLYTVLFFLIFFVVVFFLIANLMSYLCFVNCL